MRSSPHTPGTLYCAAVRFALALVALGLGARQAKADEPDGLAIAAALESALTKAIQQAEPSVVSIARYKVEAAPRNAERVNPFDLEFRRQQQLLDSRRPESQDFVPNDFGAGIVIAPAWNRDDRFILTNYHVVRGGSTVVPGEKPEEFQLYVRFSDRRGYHARILAADPRSDLAVLKIDFTAIGRKPADLKAIPIPESTSFRKGQLVLALGNPYAIGRDGAASASWGMISNVARRQVPSGSVLDEETYRRETIHHFGTLLHVDTRLNLGTSGGPLINLKGELIGVTTSLAALEGYEKSAGYAIPIDQHTKRIIEDLTRGFEVEYGLLGIQPGDKTPEELLTEVPNARIQGAAVAESVFLNSPAAEAGLQPRDLIVSINGEPVTGRFDLMRLVGLLGPDSTATLGVYRGKPAREIAPVRVNLGKWPVADEEGIISSVSRYPEWRGLSTDYSTGRKRHLPEPMRYHKAVLITKVSPRAGQSTTEANLKPGDLITHVNGIKVSTPAEFQRTVEKVEGDATLRLTDDRTVVVPK